MTTDAPVPLSPASRRAGKELRFVGTDGGPFIVVPKRQLGFWFGTNDAAGAYAYERAPTDYQRACDVVGRAGVVEVGGSDALVLAGPASTAFLPNADGGVFITWEGAEAASDLVEALSVVRKWKRLRRRLRHVGGSLVLVDANRDGRAAADLGPHLLVKLAAGTYALECGTSRIAVADGTARRTASGTFLRLTRT